MLWGVCVYEVGRCQRRAVLKVQIDLGIIVREYTCESVYNIVCVYVGIVIFILVLHDSTIIWKCYFCVPRCAV